MKIQKFINSNPLVKIFIGGQAVNRNFNVQLSKWDLSLIQALILVAIFFEEDKSTTPGHLAKTFSATKSNMSHIISNLQEKKLVSRKSQHADQRIQSICLTKEGEKICLQLISLFDRHQRGVEEMMGDRDLNKFMTQLHQFIELA